jgi:sugar transferase (PEP-CTERM system associated)
VTIEILIVLFSVYLGTTFGFKGSGFGIIEDKKFYLRAFSIAFIVVSTFYIVDLYNISCLVKKREILAKILPCFFIIGIIVAIINFVFDDKQFSKNSYLLAFAIFSPVILVCRFIYSYVVNARGLKKKILFIGVTSITRQLLDELQRGDNPSFAVLGLVAEGRATRSEDLPDCRILGTVKDLESILRQNPPDVVVVALSERRGTFPSKEILDCKLQGIRVEDWPTFYEKLTGKIHVQNLRPSWLIFADGFARSDFIRAVKRCLDLVLAIIGLCVALPFMLLIAVLLKLDSVGPVFFRQERVGERGAVFTLVKFRTMVADAEKDTGPVWAQNADPRVTRVGKILRRTGMDEIPQLFNVLKGDMSFVGPRPERPAFVAELQQQIPYYMQRLVVKPGITGWAQVRYGYGATLEDAIEKLQYDLYYIKNMSIFLDFLIILSTIHKVLFAKVALQEGPESKPAGFAVPPDMVLPDAPKTSTTPATAEGLNEVGPALPTLSRFEDSVVQ